MKRSLFSSWSFYKKNHKQKTVIVNFGPQHPAAHGVLRLILQLEGEVIKRVDPHIGLLHRGTETLATTKFYEQTIPYFDRLDYVSMMTQEHAYCLTIEKLLDKPCNGLLVNYTRILFDELTRLLNHFLAIACHALDIGSMSSIFWGFEEREKLMEFYERASGARMHAAYHRPHFNFLPSFDEAFLLDITRFVQNCFTTLNEMHNVLTYNKIWKQRLINIGVLSSKDCFQYNLTGILLRSTGVKDDVRQNKATTYSGYNLLTFRSFIGNHGDTYDRYLIRMLEMGESLSIVNQTLNYLFSNMSKTHNQKVLNVLQTPRVTQNTQLSYTSMEGLITHFINWHSGVYIKKNLAQVLIESPKGKFGVNLVANSSGKPAKCKIRSPSYYNLQALSRLCKGHYLADLAAIIGTIDIVFGEIDR